MNESTSAHLIERIRYSYIIIIYVVLYRYGSIFFTVCHRWVLIIFPTCIDILLYIPYLLICSKHLVFLLPCTVNWIHAHSRYQYNTIKQSTQILLGTCGGPSGCGLNFEDLWTIVELSQTIDIWLAIRN